MTGTLCLTVYASVLLAVHLPRMSVRYVTAGIGYAIMKETTKVTANNGIIGDRDRGSVSLVHKRHGLVIGDREVQTI